MLFQNNKGGGEPMMLNRQRLEVKAGKDYAEMLLFGDLHYGSPFCNLEKAQAMLDYALDHGIYVFLMGDLIEMATRYSVGGGVYDQISPQRQVDGIIALLMDLAKKGLIVGYLDGNHENRCYKETGIDISKNICRELKIPYLGAAGWSLLYVGDQSYTMYAIHGATGARFAQTKLKAAIDVAMFFEADIIAHAHTHDIIINSIEKERVDKVSKSVISRKCHTIVTGHYLSYRGSYAQMKGLPPGKQGSPKIKLFDKRFDIHVSV